MILGRDPGCPESPALESGSSESPSLGQVQGPGSYEKESRSYANTKDTFYVRQVKSLKFFNCIAEKVVYVLF